MKAEADLNNSYNNKTETMTIQVSTVWPIANSGWITHTEACAAAMELELG